MTLRNISLLYTSVCLQKLYTPRADMMLELTVILC